MTNRQWILVTAVLVGAALLFWYLGAGAAGRDADGLALLFRVLAGVSVSAWVIFYLVDLRRDWKESGATLRRNRDRQEK